MKKIKWSRIQKFYDEGHSWNDIMKEFDINKSTLSSASKNGLFKSRSQKEALDLYYKNNKKTISEKTKSKIGKSIKKKYNESKYLEIEFYYFFFKYVYKMRKIPETSHRIPNLKKLEKDINELGYTGTGKKYDVSDNTIRNWRNKLIEKNKIKNDNNYFSACLFSESHMINHCFDLSYDFPFIEYYIGKEYIQKEIMDIFRNIRKK